MLEAQLTEQRLDGITFHGMRNEAAIERVRRIHARAGQAEIAPDMPGAAVEKARRADIGKEADPGLRHREERALGGDAVGAVD